MSGSIDFIIGSKSRHFRKMVDGINEELSFYGLPNYDPNYSIFTEITNGNIILPGDYEPGIDLSLSDKRILRQLKTIALELEYNSQWSPGDDSLFINQPIYLDLLKEVFGEKQSHFIVHNSYSGCYVPLNFNNISVPYDFISNIGSSINLINELREVADKLNLELGDYTPDLFALAKERYDELIEDPIGDAKLMLLELYNIAFASIKYNLIISFAD